MIKILSGISAQKKVLGAEVLLTLIFLVILVILVFCIPNVNKLHRGHDINLLVPFLFILLSSKNVASSYHVSKIKSVGMH